MNRFPFLLVLAVLVSACSNDDPPHLRRVEKDSYSAHVEALVRGLAACGWCHGAGQQPDSPLSGGRAVEDRYGEVNAPNITWSESGIKSWSTTELVQAIRNARSREGEDLSQDVHRGYLWMSDDDILSIVSYIRSAPPKENDVERRSVGFISRNTTGFWESRKTVSGYVPSINPLEKVAYGQYLTNHVANCSFCHNSSPTLLSGEGYLAGGKIITRGDASKAAPALNGGPESAVKGWAENDLVQYFKTGRTPEGRQIDPVFCPHNFYRNAANAELEAMAAYLKTVPAP